MATTTPRILLTKPDPDPVTGDDVDISVLNANADKIDSVISAMPCTNATRPASPFGGQIIYETDTKRAFIWSGTTWLQIPTGTGRMLTYIEFERTVVGDWVITGHIAGDLQKRFILDASGKHFWGAGGTTNPDVTLYRSAADVLKTDDTFLAAGVVSGQSWESIRTTVSPNVTGQTETVIQTVTFPAISGVPYMITAMQNVQSTLLNDLVRVRLKWQSGNSLTAAGSTQLFTTLPNCDVVGRGVAVTMNKVFTPNATGNFTVGITFQRESATAATVISYGEADRSENTIIVAGA